MIDQMVYMHDVKKARKVLVYIRIPTPTRNVNPHHYYSHPHISSFMGSLKRFTLLKSNSFAKQNNPNFRLIGILDFFVKRKKSKSRNNRKFGLFYFADELDFRLLNFSH